jgi:hypothetical protein
MALRGFPLHACTLFAVFCQGEGANPTVCEDESCASAGTNTLLQRGTKNAEKQSKFKDADDYYDDDDAGTEGCKAFCAPEIADLTASGQFLGPNDEICSPREGVCNECCECKPFGKREGNVTVQFETMSGDIKYSGSSTGATMAFKVNDQWTEEMWLFHSVGDPGAGATDGETAEKTFEVSQWPSQMRITAGGTDAVGYQRIEFVLSNGVRFEVVRADPAIDLSYPFEVGSASGRYWVDGNNQAPRSNTFDVPSLVADGDNYCA